MVEKSLIDEIIDTARIEEVVGDYVNLKKRGANLIGLCPFHLEKTPSFSVSPSKGIYKCFGCGKAGNAVNFVMDVEQLNYIEALKQLASKYNIEWVEPKYSNDELVLQKQKQNEKESLQIINNFAERYFHEILLRDEDGITIGLSYFEERGFRPETIEKFMLGYAKDGWDNLYEEAKRNGYNIDYLISGGLLKKNDETGKVYDAYRNRVIFPIHGINGKPIAFAGRYLVKDDKSPKYVNSPETILYHKSDVLYGLYFAKQQIVRENNVYLVEGYTDVISLFQAGIENVVASSGTSLTEGQIRLIKRFTDNVCVLYDGDSAGLKASMRGIDLLLEAGLNVKVVVFPEGEDPDSYCKKLGPTDFQTFLQDSKKDFILFKAELLNGDSKGDPIRRAEVVKDIVQSICKIPDAFKRSVLITETAKLIAFDEQLLITESNRILKQQLTSQKKTDFVEVQEENQTSTLTEQIDQLPKSDAQEKDLIRVLVQYGHLLYDSENGTVTQYVIQIIRSEEITFEHPVVGQIIKELMSAADAGNEIDTNGLMRHNDPIVTAFIADILSKELDISPHWNEKYDVYIDPIELNYKNDVDSALNRLILKNIERLVEENQRLLQQYEAEQNDEQLEVHLQIHVFLIQKREILTRKTETIIIK